MCDPVSGVGLALSGAGLIANDAASRRVANARNSVNAAEAARQDEFRRQSAARFAQTVSGYDTPDAGTSLEAQQGDARSDFRAALKGLTPDVIPIGANAPETLKVAARTLADRVAGSGEAEALARAMFEGYAGMSAEQRRRLAASGVDLDQLGSLSRGSANVLGAELESANRKGDRLGAIGNLLGTVGGLTTLAGMSGAFTSPGTAAAGGARMNSAGRRSGPV